jgi:hypothetical protein
MIAVVKKRGIGGRGFWRVAAVENGTPPLAPLGSGG